MAIEIKIKDTVENKFYELKDAAVEHVVEPVKEIAPYVGLGALYGVAVVASVWTSFFLTKAACKSALNEFVEK